jgi:nucleoid-associated protein YgaU
MRRATGCALLLWLASCANANTAHPATGATTTANAAPEPNDLVRLTKAFEEQSRRVAELEARLSLLETEARDARAREPAPSTNAKPLETVHIGARKREAEPRADAEPAQSVPVVRLHEDLPEYTEPMTLPAPPPGMSAKLPVVPLPEERAKAIAGAGAASAAPRDQYRNALRLVRERRSGRGRARARRVPRALPERRALRRRDLLARRGLLRAAPLPRSADGVRGRRLALRAERQGGGQFAQARHVSLAARRPELGATLFQAGHRAIPNERCGAHRVPGGVLMKKAVSISILLALAAPSYMRAQEAGDVYQDEFTAGADVMQPEPNGEEGPHSIAEAKKQGRGYRLGAHGVHSANGQLHANGGRDVHVVQDGDTLWDISGHYFGDPWHWPELWSYNPEITNPHWIYPLDQIRLSPDALTQQDQVAKMSGAQPSGGPSRGGGGLHELNTTPGVLSGTETAPSVVVPRSAWKPGMVFLRDQGYLDQEALRTAGQIVGGNEEHMFMSPSDQLYIRFNNDEDIKPGEAYTIFRAMKGWERVEKEKGKLVRILGTTVIRSYDPDKRTARAVITEAMDPIERGVYVAKLDRRFDLVDPKPNTANVVAHVIAAIQPRTLLSYDNVVFLDVGEGHGIQPGNRFFVIRRGDEWLSGIRFKPGELGSIGDVPPYDPSRLPKEVVAELRVIKVRKNTTIALVTRSDVDLAIGDAVEMRVGF